MPISSRTNPSGHIDATNAHLFSTAAYQSIGSQTPELGANWREDRSLSLAVANRNGVIENQVRVFVNATTHEIVFAFKGSDNASNFKSDMANAGASAYKEIADLVSGSVKAAARGNPDYKIYAVGHSLGGGMAQTFALQNHVDGFGEDSLPVPTGSFIEFFNGQDPNALIENYRQQNHFIETNVAGDIATTTYSTIGRQYYLDDHPTTLPSLYSALSILAAAAGSATSGIGYWLAFGAKAKAHLLSTYSDLVGKYSLGPDGHLVVPPSKPASITLDQDLTHSYSKLVDSEGNEITFQYDSKGDPISDTWKTKDGVQGTDTIFKKNGSTGVSEFKIESHHADGSETKEITHLNDSGDAVFEAVVTSRADGSASAHLAGEGTINLEHADVFVSAGSHVFVNGRSNQFVLKDDAWLLANGDNLVVHADGANDTVTVNGHKEVVIGEHDAVWLGTGTDANIIGASNAIVANGINVWLNAIGNDDRVISTGANNTIGVIGDRAMVNASGSLVWFNASSDGNVYGNSNKIVADGQDIQLTAFGSDQSVLSTAAGNTLSLNGSRNTVEATHDAVWFNGAGSTGSVHGDGNTVVAYGGQQSVSAAGNGVSFISPYGGNTLSLNGKDGTISAANDAVWLADGAKGNIYGDGNTVVAQGNDVWAYIEGSQTNVVSAGLHETFTLNGKFENVSAEDDAIWFNSGASGTVNGAANTVVANGANEFLLVNGSNTNVVSKSSGNTFTITGNTVHVDAAGDAVWFNTGSDGMVSGDSNTIVANGIDIRLTASGDAQNLVSHFAGNEFLVDGDHDSFSGNGNLLLFTEGSDSQIYGTGNILLGLEAADFQVDAPPGQVNMGSAHVFDQILSGGANIGYTPMSLANPSIPSPAVLPATQPFSSLPQFSTSQNDFLESGSRYHFGTPDLSDDDIVNGIESIPWLPPYGPISDQDLDLPLILPPVLPPAGMGLG